MPMNLPTILTGAAVTAAVGTAAYMMTGKKKNTAKQMKKKAGKAVQAVGDIVESISSMMGYSKYQGEEQIRVLPPDCLFLYHKIRLL